MEVGVLGEVVAYLVEEEAGRELVQTLPQPMEETIVWDLLVRLVTQMTVGAIQVDYKNSCLEYHFNPGPVGDPT